METSTDCSTGNIRLPSMTPNLKFVRLISDGVGSFLPRLLSLFFMLLIVGEATGKCAWNAGRAVVSGGSKMISSSPGFTAVESGVMEELVRCIDVLM